MYEPESSSPRLASRLLICFAFLASSACAGGCAGYRVEYDYDPGTDFARYQSYHFAVAPGAQGHEGVVDDPLLAKRIEAALRAALGAKGYTKPADGRPDFFVAYLPIVNREVQYEYVQTYWGWGWGGGWQAVPRTYLRGTLIVDVADAGTQKLLWRGSVSDILEPDRDPEERQRVLDEAALALFEKFPPPARP